MREVIKRILLYDKLYPLLKQTIFYRLWKRAYSEIAASFHGRPAQEMFVIGVTGTNGKTTLVMVLHHILNVCLGKTAAINTASIKIGDETRFNGTKMSSLDPFLLQKELLYAKSEGCHLAIIETTSHGLDQYRFAGVDFDMGVLTNITKDHIDHHGSMQAYVKAKRSLFNRVMHNGKSASYAVFCKDDAYGRRWFDEMSIDYKVSYGIASSATVSARDIVERADGTSATVTYLGKEAKLETKLLGSYNVSNILGAVSAAVLMGVELEQAVAAVAAIDNVTGRMDRVVHDGVQYFVDYAHTEDALAKTLTYLRTLLDGGRLLVMCGATGDGRDKGKRPKMGALLDRYADLVVLTDDDPGQENRLEIISGMLGGFSKKSEGSGLYMIPARARALQFLVGAANPGDVVFLAGKGHEEFIVTKYGKQPRSDMAGLQALLGMGNEQ